MGKKFSARQRERERLIEDRMFNAGFSTGEQYASDCISAAAYACGVSKASVKRIMLRASELGREMQGALEADTDPEADVKRAKLDARLEAVFPEDFVPFETRYDKLKVVRY